MSIFDHRDYRDEHDFLENFRIDIPENFNFGFDCVDVLAETEPERVALIWDHDEEPERAYTFAEMKAYSDGAARYFKSIGIGKGDRVMLILKRRIHFWFAILGLIKIGAIAIPATHHLIADDIVYRNKSASVNAIVAADDDKIIKAIEAAQPESSSVGHLIRVGLAKGDYAPKYAWEKFDERIHEFMDPGSAPGMTGGPADGMTGELAPGMTGELAPGMTGELAPGMTGGGSEDGMTSGSAADELISTVTGAALPLPRVTENSDPMLLYFTSGTTGYPKMVVHDHTYPLAHIVTAKYWHNLHPGSIHFTLADTGWGKAVWGKLFGQWLCKATVFVYDHEKLVVSRLLKMLAKHRVTSFCAPPTVYKVLLTADFTQYDLSALEYATSAGEPLNDAVFYEFQERTGITIYECYGQTETVPSVLTSPYTTPTPGSIGKANPFYKMIFLKPDGEILEGPGEGEMCLEMTPGDPGVFIGYYRNPDLTKYAWRGGVYHTGDLARVDEDGYIWFIGRTDDIIKSAGYRIGPFEVESVVQQHESVLECAVTGTPDPIRGQAIKASIILREGFAPTDELKKELRAFVKAHAAAYKVPRIFEFVDELPKTISGKVRRAEMREKDSQEK